MGIDPKTWGPIAWTLIHTVSFNISTATEMRMAKHMLYSFLHILPCDKCRKNFDTHLVTLPIPSDPTHFGRWSYDLHKRITPSKISYHDAQKKWIGHRLVLADIVAFLDAIAVTHPGAKTIDVIYRDNMYNFLVSLLFFMGGKQHALPDKLKVTSRTYLKQFIRSLKRTYGVPKTTVTTNSCETSCNV